MIEISEDTVKSKQVKRFKNTRLIIGIKIYSIVAILLTIFLSLFTYFYWGVSSLFDLFLLISVIIFWIFTFFLGLRTFNPKPFEIIITEKGVTFIDRKLNEKYILWQNIDYIDKVLFEEQGMRLWGIVLKNYEKEEKDGNKIMLGGDVGKDIIKEICNAFKNYKQSTNESNPNQQPQKEQ